MFFAASSHKYTKFWSLHIAHRLCICKCHVILQPGLATQVFTLSSVLNILAEHHVLWWWLALIASYLFSNLAPEYRIQLQTLHAKTERVLVLWILDWPSILRIVSNAGWSSIRPSCSSHLVRDRQPLLLQLLWPVLWIMQPHMSHSGLLITRAGKPSDQTPSFASLTFAMLSLQHVLLVKLPYCSYKEAFARGRTSQVPSSVTKSLESESLALFKRRSHRCAWYLYLLHWNIARVHWWVCWSCIVCLMLQFEAIFWIAWRMVWLRLENLMWKTWMAALRN